MKLQNYKLITQYVYILQKMKPNNPYFKSLKKILCHLSCNILFIFSCVQEVITIIRWLPYYPTFMINYGFVLTNRHIVAWMLQPHETMTLLCAICFAANVSSYNVIGVREVQQCNCGLCKL